jgi:spore coat protein CotF
MQNTMVMNNQANCQFGDKEVMQDALTSEKYITETYNIWVNECATPEVRNQFKSILDEEHNMQNDVFCEMQTRGWYKTPAAEQPKVDQAKQNFQAI